MRRFVLLVAVLFLSGTFARADYTIKQAKAVIYNQSGKKIGVVKLAQIKEGVQLNIRIKHLPTGSHGFHFHEAARCDGPDFTTAGAHFNPQHTQHGMENPKGPHAGDLTNLVVLENGKAKGTLLNAAVTLGPGDNSLFHSGGTAILIHADPDDYTTDPSGRSGPRIACGVIVPD